MGILLGNLETFTKIGDKEKMQELEDKLKALGYRNESNCEKNNNTENLTWHIYDMPRTVVFSVISDDVITLLKSYNEYFTGQVAISANKQI